MALPFLGANSQKLASQRYLPRTTPGDYCQIEPKNLQSQRQVRVLPFVTASFAILAGTVGTLRAANASTNIAPNPSAEQVDERSKLVGWGHYENTPDRWGATDEEFHAGKRSAFLKITGFGDDDYVCTGLAVGRTDGYPGPEAIRVEANTTYHFAFYIAGYGFKRNIAVKPWGFKADGTGRDRSIEGISLVPAPEWQRYAGSFKTPPGIERVALMFFVYGLHDRDVEEGATFYVDDVCLGSEPPPAPAPATGRKSVTVPKPPPEVKGEGYSELKAGAVRIWDANKRYTMKHYDMRAWQNRDAWSQVPDGTVDYQFRGDAILEGKNFWISLHSSRHDAVFLYAKTDAEATPGRHNEIYRVFDTPNGRRNYGGGSQACRILKNTSEEICVESGAITYERGGFETTVTTKYRLAGGKPWVEIQPVSQADEQGMHGESRFVLAPEAAEDGSDFVDDSLKRPGDYVSRVPDRAKMLLDLNHGRRHDLGAHLWQSPGRNEAQLAGHALLSGQRSGRLACRLEPRRRRRLRPRVDGALRAIRRAARLHRRAAHRLLALSAGRTEGNRRRARRAQLADCLHKGD